MMFFEKWDNELRYENPMVKLRKEQLLLLDCGVKTPKVLKEIFNTIPKNFRKMYMYEAEYSKAREVNRDNFVKNLKKCLAYCIEVVG